MRLLQIFLRRYAQGEARALAPHLSGQRVLDLGAGEGWVAAALRAQTRAWTCSVDVGPFRLALEPYVIYDGATLPFRDDAFDTTLLSLVLHHCKAPEAVLDEAVRVTRSRLLVVESVYRSPLERFWLEMLDGRLNRHRHGGVMTVALSFRGPEEWHALFESRGLRLIARRWLGSRLERLIHHPLLFVLDKSPSSSCLASADFAVTCCLLQAKPSESSGLHGVSQDTGGKCVISILHNFGDHR